jgi:hypothetical protein
MYNKNTLNSIPNSTLLAINLIKSYFNLFNKTIEKEIRTKRLLLRFRRLSSNKIYISNGEFRHTNNKIIINLYIFNRQKFNYILRIRKIYLKFLKENFDNKIINTLNLINNKSLLNLKNIYKNRYNLIKALESINKTNRYIYTYNHINKFYLKLIKKSLRKVQIYFYYKQLLFINKSKLNYTYLQYISKYIEKLYNKNIEFNLINLKKFYLNSDILSESLTLKIKKNRSKIIKYLNTLKNKVRIQKNLIDKTLIKEYSNIKDNVNNDSILRKKLIKDIKYKYVTGFRLEAKGRLTRRYTASRAVSKLIYKGNLLNIDSSYKGLSSILLRGNLKSNIQYTKLNSKSRIGSFGIKG